MTKLTMVTAMTQIQPDPELPLEKQFQIQNFKSQVKNLSQQQAQDLLGELYEQTVVKDVLFQRLLAHSWGIKEEGGLMSDE